MDTAAHRASALSDLAIFVIPDAAITQGDRQTISICYGGILADPIVVAAAIQIVNHTANINRIVLAASQQINRTINHDGNLS